MKLTKKITLLFCRRDGETIVSAKNQNRKSRQSEFRFTLEKPGLTWQNVWPVRRYDAKMEDLAEFEIK